MSEEQATELVDLPTMSPKMVASKLFTKNPQDPCSCMILSYEMDAMIQFEILLTILVEGFRILSRTSYNDIDLNELTDKHISNLDPWFQSLGYFIYCNEYNKNDEYTKEYWDKYYCKIVFRNDDYKYLFELKQLDEDYHFLMGQYWKKDTEINDISDIHAIIQSDKKIFSIYFKKFTK